MLKHFLKYLPALSAQTGNTEKPVAAFSPTLQVPVGYHVPVSAQELLATSRRGQWLQMLWDYSSLPKDIYQQYYLQPLERCVALMQQFPATENGHHAYLGGMVDHLLETVAYATRLSKNYLLPVGAQPEEQATQSAAWNAVIVYAAMLQALDGLSQIEVELENGQRWMPLDIMPSEPYRFRFAPVTDSLQTQSFAAMLAWKVVPDKALHWLSAWPEVLKTLSLYLTGFRNESGIVNAIVAEAIRTSIGKTVSVGATPAIATSSPVAMISPVATNSPVGLETTLPLTDSVTVAPVILATSLDSAVSDSILDVNVATVAPVEPTTEDVTGDLLTVLGFSESDHLTEGEQGSANTTIATTESSGEVVFSDSADIGERFWQWLSEGCCSGTFSVNTAQARIHIVAGYVFIRAPNIFHQFLSENRESSEDKSSLQSAFERLGRHRQDKGGMYTCQVYHNASREGRFQKMTGYLIMAKKLYKSHSVPESNPAALIAT